MKRLLICLLCCVFLVGCSAGVSKKKFEDLYRSAKTIEGAVAVGVSYQKFGELLQGLSAEISIASDKAKTKKEIEFLKFYIDALDIYKDSQTLWAWKIEQVDYSHLVQSGYIIMINNNPAIKPIAIKYDLPMSTFEMTAFGKTKAIEQIPESSIQHLWELANKKVMEANSLSK